MFSKFVLNFWLWWYFINFKNASKSALRIWLYWLGFFNLVPMVTNLFVPLYQDYSAIGRITSLGIRSVWIFVGGIFQVFLTIPVLLYVIIIFILPVVPIVMIASSFI